LINDLISDDITKTKDGAFIIRKIIKVFKEIDEFEDYLAEINYQDFK